MKLYKISTNSMTAQCGAFECTGPASLCLDVCRPDHLGPLFLVIYDELSEVGGRAGNHRATEIGEPRLHLGIGERRIDFLIELVDDFGRCGVWCADAEPSSRWSERR